MQIETQRYRGYTRTGTLTAETAAECRFGGEVETVLAAQAEVSPVRAEAENGEVRILGRARFSIVYENAEHGVCRAEKGAEFTLKAQGACCPAASPRVELRTESLSVRREGASVYVTALVSARAELFEEKEFVFLTGGELVVRREGLPFSSAHLVGGETEIADDFETDFLGDILLHSSAALVKEARAEAGSLVLSGEVNLCILALREGEPVSLERLIPFRIEIASESALPGCPAEGRVAVKEVFLHADADEEQGKCALHAELTLSAEGCVYTEETVDAVTDAYSLTHRVELSFAEAESTSAGETASFTERIAGKAALSSAIDYSDTLLAVILQRAEGTLVPSPEGRRLEGAVLGTLLLRGADGAHRGVEMSVPFSVPAPGEGECTPVLLVCGMSARQKQEGEIDAEATLKFSLTPRRRTELRAVCAAEEGEPVAESDCAVSVYIPRAGDGLWELSKRLKKPPEEVMKSNPELEFPIREGQRVIIYRKRELSVPGGAGR